MSQLNNFRDEISELIKSGSGKVYYVGPKPPENRLLTKFKLGLVALFATFGMSSIGVADMVKDKQPSFSSFNNLGVTTINHNLVENSVVNHDDLLNKVYGLGGSEGKPLGDGMSSLDKNVDVSLGNSISELNRSDSPIHTNMHKDTEKTIEMIGGFLQEEFGRIVFNDTPPENPKNIREKFPGVNFNEIETQRDVSAKFLPYSTFISLASEMEGFRGDLHKDPAVGLNIGFGYNITKRAAGNSQLVTEELKYAGVDEKIIPEVIKLSQVPQEKLESAIKSFNKKHRLKDGQLISLEQGVSLLGKTEAEYRAYAKESLGEKTFNNMSEHQRQVMTYITYKVGFEGFKKYKNTINSIRKIFSDDSEKSPEILKKLASKLKFYYQKDGGDYVPDVRAGLIGDTLVHRDLLAKHVGALDHVSLSNKELSKYKVQYNYESRIAKNKEKENGQHKSSMDGLTSSAVGTNETSNFSLDTQKVSSVLFSMRNAQNNSNNNESKIKLG